MVLSNLGIKESDLWDRFGTHEKCLWDARIFPLLSTSEMLNSSMWLMGLSNLDSGYMLSIWRSSQRVGLEELHRSIDFPQLCMTSSNHQADLAAGIAKACLTYGLLGRNLSQLCDEILQKDTSGVEICKEFLDLHPSLEFENPGVLPQSRAYQVQVDLLRACGDELSASKMEQRVWTAVASETASAVKYGIQDHCFDSNDGVTCALSLKNNINGTFQPKLANVESPVRVDFVGGWSDTPPWSLERSGCVLNMAISLEGILQHNLLSIFGLKIKTQAEVPRGSGLGTSSMLAASVVKGLLNLMEEDESNENVARIVLVLEQIMGTGGGWQGQIGGLYAGIKCTFSFPGQPLRLEAIPLVASPQLVGVGATSPSGFHWPSTPCPPSLAEGGNQISSQRQFAHIQYQATCSIAALARNGREALMKGDIDELGEIMLEAWRLPSGARPFLQ